MGHILVWIKGKKWNMFNNGLNKVAVRLVNSKKKIKIFCWLLMVDQFIKLIYQ